MALDTLERQRDVYERRLRGRAQLAIRAAAVARVGRLFAGSGPLGAVAAALGRHYVLIDSNPRAVEVMLARLGAQAEVSRAHSARPKDSVQASR